MRNALIVVSALTVLLLLGFIKVRRNAASELEAARKEIVLFSNKVTEAQTRLVLGQALTVEATNKMKAHLDQVVQRGLALSNQLHQAHTHGERLRQELEAARASLSSNLLYLETLEAQLHQTETDLEQARSAAAATDKLLRAKSVAESERDKAMKEIERLRLAAAETESLLRNPAFLRARLEQVQREARAAQQAPRDNMKRYGKEQAPLKLNEDGTVLVMSVTNSAFKAATPRR